MGFDMGSVCRDQKVEVTKKVWDVYWIIVGFQEPMDVPHVSYHFLLIKNSKLKIKNYSCSTCRVIAHKATTDALSPMLYALLLS